VDLQFLLKDKEREVFVGMYEEFCGVRVLSYCVMSNHFHILLEIPPRMDVVDLSDEEFLAKLGLDLLRCVCERGQVADVENQ
jgi:putative transposase